jgi:hypothetical protein
MYAGVMDEDDPGLTNFNSSSDALNTVWELNKYTIRVGTMDVNTDSNTRQRDNCNLDSMLQTMAQVLVAPSTALRYVRRNTAYLNQPDAIVHGWTEFQIANIGAAWEYTMHSGDASVANVNFDHLKYNCSLLQFFDNNSKLISKHIGEPGYQNLIDWPDSQDIFAPEQERCCRDGYKDGDKSTAINAHAFLTLRRLADIADWTGKPSSESETLRHISSLIQEGMAATMTISDAKRCDPPAGPCMTDSVGLKEPHSANAATMYAVGCGVFDGNSRRFLPFLMARNKEYPKFSAQSSLWLFDGLYAMGAENSSLAFSDAANYAFDILTRSGHRSWLEMVAHNASMAIEHWYGVSFDAHSWSHPWSAAAPVRAVVSGIMGISSIEPGWQSISIHPQPPTSGLSWANITIQTPRGEVASMWSINTHKLSNAHGSFTLDVTVPGNTKAFVCLPWYIVGDSVGNISVMLNESVIPSEKINIKGNSMCLVDAISSGHWSFSAI